MCRKPIVAIPFVVGIMFLATTALSQTTHNRAIERIEFVEDATSTTIRILYALTVSDPLPTATLNLNADILVEVNGTLHDVIAADATSPAGGAVTCAVTCAGSCPSIFGDGVCTGCGCRYSNWLTTTFGGGGMGSNIQVTARVVPARGGQAEQDTSDDVLTGMSNPRYDRSIEAIEFQSDPTGGTLVRVLYGLILRDTSTESINLNADVEIMLNGALVATLAADATKPAGGAITCAVTCAGECPSIFGDGVCGGCSCNYSNWLTTALGGASEGDEVVARLVAERDAAPELNNGNDALTVRFVPQAIEQHDWQDAVHFDFWVMNTSTTTVIDNFHISRPRLVFENLPGTQPDESVLIKCCSIFDPSPMFPTTVPDRWCRVNQIPTDPHFRKEAWWFFPRVDPGQMAPAMDVAFSVPATVNPNDLGQRLTWYEVDYELTSGAETVSRGVFRFRCDSLVTTSVSEDLIQIGPPRLRHLEQNYPNPFNPGTTIGFQVHQPAETRLEIFSVRGELVRTLVQRRQEAGAYEIHWDGTDDAGRRLPSGAYYYQLEIGDTRESRKMVILK